MVREIVLIGTLQDEMRLVQKFLLLFPGDSLALIFAVGESTERPLNLLRAMLGENMLGNGYVPGWVQG